MKPSNTLVEVRESRGGKGTESNSLNLPSIGFAVMTASAALEAKRAGEDYWGYFGLSLGPGVRAAWNPGPRDERVPGSDVRARAAPVC